MKPPLSFRAATADDLQAIVALLADDELGREREDPADALHPGYLAALAAIASNPDDMQVVAEREGRVVGCLQLTFLPGLSHRGAWRGQIEGVRVASDLRGGGIGREMMLWAIARCRERGCRVVQLTSNAVRSDAQRFYRSLGFGASHVGMKLDLPAD